MSQIHSLRDFSRYSHEERAGSSFPIYAGEPELQPDDLRCIDVFFPKFTWKSGVLWVSIVQCIVFVITICFGSSRLEPSGHTLSIFGSASGLALEQGKVWCIVTAIFLHGSIWHLLLNVYFQLRTALPLERAYGAGTILIMYFATGIAGNLFSVAWSPCSSSVGASTAGFGLIGIGIAELAVSWNRIPNKDQEIMNIIMFAIFSALLAANPNLHIDWRGHLGGALAGFFGGLLLIVKLMEPSVSLPKWIKPTGLWVSLGVLAALYIACPLIIFLIPIAGKRCLSV